MTWRRSRWRWLVVLVPTALLVSLPAAVDRLPVDTAEIAPSELAALVARSTQQPYQGYAVTRGALDLPDVDGAESPAALLSDTSTLRVWYRGPNAFRVDRITLYNERDVYVDDLGYWIWDSQLRESQRVNGQYQVRLPRSSDVLPPELARRLVAAASPQAADLQPIAPRRVAGRAVPGFRIVPRSVADRVITTISHADIWVEPRTGVAQRVEVFTAAHDEPALEARFLQFSSTQPSVEGVTFTPPLSGTIDLNSDDGLDAAQRIERFPTRALPNAIAGLGRRTQRRSAAATYGSGFEVVDVFASPRNVESRLPASVPTSPRPWGGTARLIEGDLINAMVVSGASGGFVITGAVPLATLDRVAEALTR